jgi:hypothetical protein
MGYIRGDNFMGEGRTPSSLTVGYLTLLFGASIQSNIINVILKMTHPEAAGWLLTFWLAVLFWIVV